VDHLRHAIYVKFNTIFPTVCQCTVFIILFYFQWYDWHQTILSTRPSILALFSRRNSFRAGRRTSLTIGDTAQTCRSYKLRDRHGTRSIFNLQFCHNGIAWVSWKSGATLTLLHRGSHSGNAAIGVDWNPENRVGDERLVRALSWRSLAWTMRLVDRYKVI